ncbi:MAG: DUF4861 domain-containing protein, partial [Marinilabiliaceae bacterium]|nr:DUF4861 domain-containing protein [Marinilabiliaceae bacterium]
ISGTLFSCQEKVAFSVKNPVDLERTDEVVVLSKNTIAQKVDLKEGWLPVFKLGDEKLVPSQLDDLDGDGNWDEAALVLNLKAHETVQVTIDLVPENEYPVFEKRTNVRLGIKQADGTYKEFDTYRAIPVDEPFEVIAQSESVAWENDKMAFRNYFDCRNIKDLFGKLKPDMILDKMMTPGMGSYHKLADWGMDVLHCGSSLGSGGLALLKNDSLIRLGSTDIYDYQKLVEGPVRSILELRYKGWDVDGEKLEAVEKITIYPGKYWFESDVTLSAHPEGSQLVTGIVNSYFKGEPFQMEAAGFKAFGTHGVQSLNSDELGMAVLMPGQEAGQFGRTTDNNYYALGHKTVDEKRFSHIISESYYGGQKYQSGKPARHYFFAVWGLEKAQWKTEKGFKKYIAQEAEKLSQPLQIL